MNDSLAQAYIRQAKADFICYRLVKAGGQPAQSQSPESLSDLMI